MKISHIGLDYRPIVLVYRCRVTEKIREMFTYLLLSLAGTVHVYVGLCSTKNYRNNESTTNNLLNITNITTYTNL